MTAQKKPTLILMNGNELRNVLLYIYDLATGRYIQSDKILRQRIADKLNGAILKRILGRGGPYNDLDTLKRQDRHSAIKVKNERII